MKRLTKEGRELLGEEDLRMSKAEAGYTLRSKPGMQCRFCEHFVRIKTFLPTDNPLHRCQRVEGTIVDTATCKHFSRTPL